MTNVASGLAGLLAVTETRTIWNWPEETWQWVVYGGGFVLAIVLAIAVYLRDASEFSPFWRGWLTFLRVAVIAGIIVVALHPQQRTTQDAVRRSRVAVLVDTSTSMNLKESVPPPGASPAEVSEIRTRSEAVREVLADSPLIPRLQERHDVSLYTFSEKLEPDQQPHHVFASVSEEDPEGEDDEEESEADEERQEAEAEANQRILIGVGIGCGVLLGLFCVLAHVSWGARGVAAVTGSGLVVSAAVVGAAWYVLTYGDLVPEPESPGPLAASSEEEESEETAAVEDVDWETLVRPEGQETRLGDSLRELLQNIASETLSGIVIFTDGANNAGGDPQVAHRLAQRNNVRLVTVGVGSTRKQPNLRISALQMPSRVQVNDPYEIATFVQGQQMQGRLAQVDLLARPADAPDARPEVVETREIRLTEDGIPEKVVFTRTPMVEGETEYVVRVRSSTDVRELREDDNSDGQTVTVSKRKTRVLLLAGGPTREYRFVSTALARHGGIESSIWLQTVSASEITAVSQDADNPPLVKFPSRTQLFDYDVVIAFDPDWSQLAVEERDAIAEWVEKRSGGLVVLAGDVFTPELVSADASFDQIREILPVVLDPFMLDFQFDLREDDPDQIQPWPLAFTPAGQNVEFLQLGENPAQSAEIWEEFEGVYRCYPTGGVKLGAEVFAHFSNPRAIGEDGPHVLLAKQFYGSGQVMYLGSPEIWRMRAVDEEYYERFWTKVVREVGQGRLKQGGNRSLLSPERDRYFLGQTVKVRARLLDAQYEPIEVDSVGLEVVDPKRKPLIPKPKLLPDPNRPGSYVGDFRANLDGAYDLILDVPGTGERVSSRIQVKTPQLETDEPEQNAKLLTDLQRDTGGRYVPIAEAASAVPDLFLQPSADASRSYQIDEQLDPLWDRSWVLFLLVGLLSVEWLTRKLLKLA